MARRSSPHVVVIGAGPAGLTAAYELAKQDFKCLVLEKSNQVGGIARTETHDGNRYDIGGHRFFTKVTEVENLWYEVMAADFIKVPRLSRIHYRGRYFSYPLEPWNALSNLGLYESTRILLSYLKWKVFPHKTEESFEEWVTNRFGGRLYWHFFKTYTEKVWGISCQEIRADWAAQRIKGLSLRTAVLNAFFGGNEAKSLIKEFDYPVLGPGMMWERFRDLIEAMGSEVEMETEIVRLQREGDRIVSVTARHDGQDREITAEHFINSMPLAELVSKIEPPPPPEVRDAAHGLSYRDFLQVGLVLKKDKLFPDNWIYIHTPGVKVGRIQNFGNWSKAMVATSGTTSLGMEYFCNEGDDLWTSPDADLIALASQEVVTLGLASADDVVSGVVIRQPKAYPVYDGTYRQHLDVLRDYVQTLTNFQTIGRNGMHRYNNQDHSMLTAILAARNVMGESHDLWEVNTERSYHEDFVVKKKLETPTNEPVSTVS